MHLQLPKPTWPQGIRRKTLATFFGLESTRNKRQASYVLLVLQTFKVWT